MQTQVVSISVLHFGNPSVSNADPEKAFDHTDDQSDYAGQIFRMCRGEKSQVYVLSRCNCALGCLKFISMSNFTANLSRKD